LAIIMAEPRNGYEIVGVLREVFGLLDHELAAFSEGHGDRWQIVEPTIGTGVIVDALNLLASMRATILPLPLFPHCGRSFNSRNPVTDCSRCRTTNSTNLDAELDDLLTVAANAETGGQTLASFADELRAGFSATREVRTSRADAVQLITSHKSQRVGVAGRHRPIFCARGKATLRPYPRLLRDPRTGVCTPPWEGGTSTRISKTPPTPTPGRNWNGCSMSSLTRARHTLVLMHDHALFTGKTACPKNAGARLLRLRRAAAKILRRFTALSTER